MSNTEPDRIYLQWHCEEHDPEWGDPDPGDVTWARESVFSDDLVYVAESKVVKLQQQLAVARTIVNEQAEDEGLWSHAKTAPEAYLQQELRRLHKALEKMGFDSEAKESGG